jgi:putative MATE family efflux protein
MKHKSPDNLQSESIAKLLWSYSIPAIIGTMANALYNIVDRIYIGQGVGALAISGLSLTLPIMLFFAATGMLIGAGSAARISISLGEKDKNKAEKILGNALVLTFIISAIVFTLSYIFLKDILILFGGSEETIPYAEKYLRIIIPAQILPTLTYGYNNMMRASGYPRKAMYTMLLGASLNIILDPIFIFGFDMGIEGAAYATVIAMFINCIWVMSHFLNKNNYIHFSRQNFKLERKIIFSIISIGLSPFLMHVSGSIINVIINQNLVKYGGDLAIGAYGIINSFVVLLIMAILGINQGMQPILGYNYGAKEYGRVKQTLKYGIIVASVITFIGFLIGTLIPEKVVRAFTADENLMGVSVNGMRIYMSMFMIVGFQVITTSFFQSIGKAKIAIVLSLTRQVLLIIPFLYILPLFFHLNGVWMAQPTADTISSIIALSALLYQLNQFKKYTTI